MWKGSGFALVERHRTHLLFQGCADIDKYIGSKWLLEATERPFGRRKHFIGIDLFHGTTSHGTGCRQRGPIQYHVVYVQISAVVGIDNLRTQLGHEAFDEFCDLEKGHRVETVVWQAVHEQLFGAEQLFDLMTVAMELADVFRTGLLALSKAGRDPFPENGDRYLMSFFCESWAMAPPQPNTSSSGCAAITRTFIRLLTPDRSKDLQALRSTVEE